MNTVLSSCATHKLLPMAPTPELPLGTLANASFDSPTVNNNSSNAILPTGWSKTNALFLGRGNGGGFNFTTAGMPASFPQFAIMHNASTTTYPTMYQSVYIPIGSFEMTLYSVGRGGTFTSNPTTILIDSLEIGNFTPSVSTWTQYSFIFENNTAGTKVLTFRGTPKVSADESTTITGITLTPRPLDTLVNADFSNPTVNDNSIEQRTIPGWTGGPTSGIRLGRGTGAAFQITTVNAPGAFPQWVMLQGTSAYLYQSLYVPQGTYTFECYAAGRNPTRQNQMLLYLDTQYIGTFTPSSTTWTKYTFVFTNAAAGTKQLTFKGIHADGGTPLDKSACITGIAIF